MPDTREEPASTASNFYDEVWQRYGNLDAASPAAFHRRRLVVELSRAHARTATQILDVGSGRGELLGELRRAFPDARLCACDVSPKSVRETQRTNPELEVWHMDLAAGNFENAQRAALERFELITCSEVLEHIADDCLAAERLARLLRPGGTLVLTVPGGKMSRFDRAIGHHRHYASVRLRELSLHANLEPVAVWAWGFPFQNLYRSLVRAACVVSMPDKGGARPGDSQARTFGALLGTGYTLLGRALKPLFYLNRSYWGEQMLLVARKI